MERLVGSGVVGIHPAIGSGKAATGKLVDWIVNSRRSKLKAVLFRGRNNLKIKKKVKKGSFTRDLQIFKDFFREIKWENYY